MSETRRKAAAMERYRQLKATAETNTKAAYTEKAVKKIVGAGTKVVQDRYKKSGPSYPVPEVNYPFRYTIQNENWQQPYIEPLTAISVALQASYGSRYRVAGVGNTGNRLVVIQNPVAPIQATEHGYRAIANNARLGQFLAEMNAAAVVRRRRGQ